MAKRKVTPLRQQTMSLDELQERTLKILKSVRKQLVKAHWEDGLTDDEFIKEVIVPFETVIHQDRWVLKNKP